MNWYELNIEPRDVLFFRNAKPISGAAIGEGGNWPFPSVFHHALLSAFHERWPERQTWEHNHHVPANPPTKSRTTYRFGGLQAVGVFPAQGDTLYFPTPADLLYADDRGKKLCLLEPGSLAGEHDLPAPLKYGCFKPAHGQATKKTPGQWLAGGEYERYLNGEVEELKTTTTNDLYEIEYRPGIGIDPRTGAADIGDDEAGGKFYLAEYLRLKEYRAGAPGISMKGFATCIQSRAKDGTATDVKEQYFAPGHTSHFVFGGQRGVAQLQGVRNGERNTTLFKPRTISSRRIKWTLLTPAIFTKGWLPGWICPETGAVRSFSMPEREKHESRAEWRKRVKDEVKESILGHLVAACINKPMPCSGWNMYGGKQEQAGARPTRLCVPAGSVYYFEVPDDRDPMMLVNFLNGTVKSDIAAEQGFGFGLCSSWKPYTGEK
jgi:CRISPR-associated protein Cmr3